MSFAHPWQNHQFIIWRFWVTIGLLTFTLLQITTVASTAFDNQFGKQSYGHNHKRTGFTHSESDVFVTLSVGNFQTLNRERSYDSTIHIQLPSAISFARSSWIWNRTGLMQVWCRSYACETLFLFVTKILRGLLMVRKAICFEAWCPSYELLS